MKTSRVMLLAALALSMALFAPAALAAEYYLSPEGADTAQGFRTAPWRTFEKANSVVRPGDVVHVLPGRYEGAKLNAKGTADAPITYVSTERQKAVIDLGGFPTGSTEGSRISIWGDYTVFDGFRVSTGQAREGRAANAGIAVYRCTGVVVRNCHSHANDRWGIFSAWAAELTLENNICHDNRREHGIYVSNGGDNPRIVGNVCYDNGGCGIQINTDKGTIHGALLERNLLYDNNKIAGQSINFDGVARAVVRNNVIIINRRTGIALYRIDGGEVCHDNVIVNNTFINVSGRGGILLNDGAHSNFIFNNVLHSGVSSVTMIEGNVSANAIRNNAFASNTVGGNAVVLEGELADHFAEPGRKDFALKAGSPLVDAGIPSLRGRAAPQEDFAGSARPAGEGFDIGAFELAP